MRRNLVVGVGINDLDEPVCAGDQTLAFYQCWRNMLCRCYDEKNWIKQPTYRGCGVVKEWLRLSVFKAWYDANHITGFQMDKDILVPGNTIYGPDTCVFVPRYVNNLLLDHKAARGELPLGVSVKGDGFQASVNLENCKQRCKTFDTVEEAVAWYTATKRAFVRKTADNALAAGHIDGRVHAALLQHKFDGVELAVPVKPHHVRPQKQRLVFGVGINDLPGTCKPDGMGLFQPRWMGIWRGIMQRCYDSKFHSREPTYAGCTVDPRWHRLSEFKTWFEANHREGCHLDKDILVPGNKVYGPDTCVFVPGRVNKLLNLCDSRRGDLPLGVTRVWKRRQMRYTCTCRSLEGTLSGVCYKTIEETVRAYGVAKGRVIRGVAAEALLAHEIDDRIYCGLIRHAQLFESGQRQIKESPYWALIA